MEFNADALPLHACVLSRRIDGVRQCEDYSMAADEGIVRWCTVKGSKHLSYATFVKHYVDQTGRFYAMDLDQARAEVIELFRVHDITTPDSAEYRGVFDKVVQKTFDPEAEKG